MLVRAGLPTDKMASCILMQTCPARVHVAKSPGWAVLVDIALFGSRLNHCTVMPGRHMHMHAGNELLIWKKNKGEKQSSFQPCDRLLRTLLLF